MILLHGARVESDFDELEPQNIDFHDFRIVGNVTDPQDKQTNIIFRNYYVGESQNPTTFVFLKIRVPNDP